MITCQRRRLRTAAGGGVDADHSVSGAPCPPSLRDQTHTYSGHPRRFAGEDRESEVRPCRYALRGSFRNRCAPAFDIVTVEGEGCSAAGWEEMSEGDSARKTDGISADEGFVRVPSWFLIWTALIFDNYGCFQIRKVLSAKGNYRLPIIFKKNICSTIIFLQSHLSPSAGLH